MISNPLSFVLFTFYISDIYIARTRRPTDNFLGNVYPDQQSYLTMMMIPAFKVRLISAILDISYTMMIKIMMMIARSTDVGQTLISNLMYL